MKERRLPSRSYQSHSLWRILAKLLKTQHHNVCRRDLINRIRSDGSLQNCWWLSIGAVARSRDMALKILMNALNLNNHEKFLSAAPVCQRIVLPSQFDAQHYAKAPSAGLWPDQMALPHTFIHPTVRMKRFGGKKVCSQKNLLVLSFSFYFQREWPKIAITRGSTSLEYQENRTQSRYPSLCN